MQINAYPFPSALSEKQYFQKTVIVVDILRATTTMLTALENGATQVIPVREPQEAMAFISQLGRKDSLLAGESGGLKINGFDLGNSPLEFEHKVVKGKNVVMCTTNGTGAIHAARAARRVMIGCLRNRTAVARAAITAGNDIILLCAGTKSEASMDDMVAVGGIYRALQGCAQTPVACNDFLRVCGVVYDLWAKGSDELAQSTHYQTLVSLGFQADIDFCLMQDQSDYAPLYDNGSLRLQ